MFSIGTFPTIRDSGWRPEILHSWLKNAREGALESRCGNAFTLIETTHYGRRRVHLERVRGPGKNRVTHLAEDGGDSGTLVVSARVAGCGLDVPPASP